MAQRHSSSGRLHCLPQHLIQGRKVPATGRIRIAEECSARSRCGALKALSLSRLAPSKRPDQRDYIFLPPRIILYFTVKLTVKLCVRIPIVPVNFRVNVP